MARKSTHEQRQSYTQSFEVMAIHEDKQYDPGLVQFRRAMANAERALHKDKEGIEAEGIIAELNANWPFHGQEVTLSGKIYLSDEDADLHLEEFIPDSWGTKRIDNWGTFYEVEDARLASMGVAEITGPTKASPETSVSYVYGFDIGDDEPSFIVRPGDIYKAEYPYPTYEACEAHLRHEYPELFAEINRRIRPSTYDFNRLNDTLQLLVEKYPAICMDASLGVWTSMYINRRVKFDSDSPYGFVVNGEMSVPDEDGDVETYLVDEPFGFDARIQGVAFARTANDDPNIAAEGVVEYMLILPSGIMASKEYPAAQAIVPVSSVVSIEPRRPIVSLVEQLRQAALEKVRPELARLGLSKISASAIEYAELSEDTEEPELVEPISETIRLEEYEGRFATIKSRLKEIRGQRFEDIEEAELAVNALTKEMAALLAVDERIYSVLLEVYGNGVQLPTFNKGRAVGENGQQLVLSVDENLTNPSRATEVRGTYRGIKGTIEQGSDETYLPVIYMYMGYKQDEPLIPMMQFESVPIVSVTVEQSCVVRMDDTSAIKIVALERFRQRQAAMERLAALQNARHEQKVINRLSRAMSQEIPYDMIALGKMNYLRSLDHLIRTTKHPHEVFEAVKALIGDSRQVKVSGTVFSASGEHSIVDEEVMYCLDVVRSIPNNTADIPALVVRASDNVSPLANPSQQSPFLYMPIRDITQFHY